MKQPLEDFWEDNKPYFAINIQVNSWQKNFLGLCGHPFCKEAVTVYPHWGGTWQDAPEHIKAGVLLLSAPSEYWLPQFCAKHERPYEDKQFVAVKVREYLLSGGQGLQNVPVRSWVKEMGR